MHIIQKPCLSLAALTLLGLGALPAHAKPPVVVADIPIVGAMIGQVMGDLGAPVVLMEAGGDPHDYQMRPSQARALNGADMLVWVGPALSPWLSHAAQGLKPQDSLALLALPGTHTRDFGAAGGDHDHDHDHDHQGGDSGHDGHDHSGKDPHAWLDPANGAAWLDAIADALAERDPDNAATYRDNAAKGVAEIKAADADNMARLAPFKDSRFVVFHDAYGYFTEHYGLQPAIAVSLGDASAPSAARLKQIRDEIAGQNAACAFPEANHDARLLAAATEGTDIRQGAALAPEGKPSEGALSYPQFLRDMGGAIADCLGQK